MGISARTDAARAFVESAVQRNPRLVPALELYAPFLLDEGASARVIELLSPVYAEVQDRFETLRLLGLAYHREGDAAKAIEVLEKAVAIRRPTPELLNALAEDHAKSGNRERALQLLERSLEEDADQPAVRARLEELKALPEP